MTDGSKYNDMTSSLGIMTLTRTPCELEKMSLFQDLKLKRRKIDSRCSSDGESVADTSTSSPDLVCPASPKMSELPTARSPQSPDSTPGAAQHPPSNSITPNNTATNGGDSETQQQSGSNEQPMDSTGVFDGGGNSNNYENSVPPPKPSPVASPVVPQTPPPPPPPAQTPPTVIRLPQHCPSPASSQQQQQQQRPRSSPSSAHPPVIQLSPIRSQSPVIHAPTQVITSRSSQTPPTSQQSHIIRQSPIRIVQTPPLQQQRSHSPMQQQQQQQVIRSPIQTLSSQQTVGMVSHQQMRQQQHSPVLTAIRQSPLHHQNTPARSQSPYYRQSPPAHHKLHSPSSPVHLSQLSNQNFHIKQSPSSPVHLPQLSNQNIHIKQNPSSPVHLSNQNIHIKQSPSSPIHVLPSSRQSPGMPHHHTIIAGGQTSASPRLQNPVVRNTPGVITSQHQAAAAVIQSQFWAQNTRINGVKPELIGGNLLPGTLLSDMKPPSLLSPSQRAGSSTPAIRQTPTVIMGEAGGVRTMIWSQPAAVAMTSAQSSTSTSTSDSLQVHASTSNWSNSSNSSNSGGGGIGSNPEENAAAQMLLNLGQDTLRAARATPQTGRILPVRTPPNTPVGVPLNMERLWAGDLTQLPVNQQIHALNLSAQQQSGGGNIGTSNSPLYITRPGSNTNLDVKPATLTGMTSLLVEGAANLTQPELDNPEEEDQPMICMICEDKATGLHYGIITCEGCKGFFKRTVQNRRVYTCVADGNCEITKAQRNRCQYCRFKKCIEQGMVLQAVREDRMPGGRNSGAVYNLYKVKYKKHKKTSKQNLAHNKQQTDKTQIMATSIVKTELISQQSQHQQQHSSIPPHLVNGTILKTALTNPSEVVHLRQRLDNAVSSSRDRNYSIENTLSMIQTLIDCDEFEDIATLQNIDDLLDHKSDLSEKLCQIGDSIVYKLVQWTKRLPFYLELPVEVHTRLLTHKWHELLVLTTSAYQAIHGVDKNQCTDLSDVDFAQEVNNNLCMLQNCLTSMMGRSISMDQLRQDVGLMVEKITHVTLMFRRVRLTMHEYVCLKVITMLNQDSNSGGGGNDSGTGSGSSGNNELEAIQERYTACLKALTQHMHPQQPTRFHELLVRLPEVQSAAALLLESKMFYVPFLLNSAIQR